MSLFRLSKSGLFLALIAMTAIALTGCPSKEVVVVDDHPEIDVSEVSENALEFVTDGAPSTPLEVGDIVVGEGHGGFLRRILGISEGGGGIFADTGFVSLAEAVNAGQLDADVQFTNDDFEKAGVKLAKAGSTTIDLSGTTIFSKDGLSVVITRGTIDYAPEITLDAVWADHKLVSMETSASGPLTVDMDVRLQATKPVTVSHEWTLWSINKPFVFSIGPIPVAGSARLSFPLGVTGTIEGTAAVEAGFDATTFVTVGGKIENGKWNDLTDFGSFEPNGHPPVFTFTSAAGATVYLKAIAGLNLYGASDLTGGPTVYCDADAWLYPAPQTLRITAGIDGDLGYELGIFDLKLVDESWHFPGPSWVLYENSWN